MMATKLTNQQIVLKKYPEANLVRDGYQSGYGFFDFAIFKDKKPGGFLGAGESPVQAWASARADLTSKGT